PPAMARDLPARLDHRARSGGVALECLADPVHGQRQAVLREDPVDAPEPGAAPVLEHRLGVQIAATDRGRRAHDLVQERLRGGIALERRVLAAFLVVEDEAEREPRAARPPRIGRMLAIADEVTRQDFPPPRCAHLGMARVPPEPRRRSGGAARPPAGPSPASGARTPPAAPPQ